MTKIPSFIFETEVEGIIPHPRPKWRRIEARMAGRNPKDKSNVNRHALRHPNKLYGKHAKPDQENGCDGYIEKRTEIKPINGRDSDT